LLIAAAAAPTHTHTFLCLCFAFVRIRYSLCAYHRWKAVRKVRMLHGVDQLINSKSML